MNKKRTNIYLDEQDKALLAIIRQRYNLSSDAAAVRFAINKVVKEGEKPHVSSQTGEDRQDNSVR
jgi:Arc/MetJ family transcription regulator